MASTFHLAREPGSFTLSPDLTEAQRAELTVEVQFYGLLDRMMPVVPYYAQEQIGVAILKSACVADNPGVMRAALRTAAGAYTRRPFSST